jgi:hypothetical protein
MTSFTGFDLGILKLASLQRNPVKLVILSTVRSKSTIQSCIGRSAPALSNQFVVCQLQVINSILAILQQAALPKQHE